MPDYAPTVESHIKTAKPIISDRNLSVMYKNVQTFASAIWEERESQMFNMIGNQLSEETVNYFHHLLDIDQLEAVAQFLGPVSSVQHTDCGWFKPKKKDIEYVQGGSCINGKLNGVAEFIYKGNRATYSFWMEMKNGEAVKGVHGQNQHLRTLPNNSPGRSPFHNWSGRYSPSQVEALAVGGYDKNFDRMGIAASQGFGGKYRYIGEFSQNRLNGWGTRYQILYDTLLSGEKYKGIKLVYLGQWKNGDWNGVGVRTFGGENYLALNGHWVPFQIEYSLGWKLGINNYYKSNGPTISFYALEQDNSSNLYSRLYSGYDKDGERQGLGRDEKYYLEYGRTVFIGNYVNNKKVGKHEFYPHGRRDNSGDMCYASDGSNGLCSAMDGDGMGKFLALAAGAVLADSSGMSSSQKLDFMTSYSVDVLTDSGGTNTRKWGNQETQKTQSNMQVNNKKNSNGSSSGDGQSAMKEEGYTFTCPDTQKQHTIQVPYFTTSCLTAAKNFAKVNGCNMVNEMTTVSQQCQSACGHPQCLENPPSGTQVGSGDDEMDFLNGQ